jgi:hypothetical protein
VASVALVVIRAIKVIKLVVMAVMAVALVTLMERMAVVVGVGTTVTIDVLADALQRAEGIIEGLSDRDFLFSFSFRF